jgi:catechol 2,3-dioxygenase-like lactoylglutathione lyase family enzyme
MASERRSPVYDHVGLKIADLEAGVRFYRAALEPLGFVLCTSYETGAGLGPEGSPALWLSLAKGRARTDAHVAFRATSRGAVDAFHKAGLAAGGRDNGAPGLRPDYGPAYYAAFLVDPDGNNVEAVCNR